MKKRLFGAVIILAMLLQLVVVPVSAEDVVLQLTDDFSAFEPGTDYLLAGNAKYKYGSTEGVVTVRNDGDGNGNYVEIDSKNIIKGNSSGVGFPINNLTGKITYTFDYRRIAGGAHCYAYYGGAYALSAILATTPFYYNSKSQGVDMEGFIVANKWLNITIVIDCDNNNIDVYIDGYKVADKIAMRCGTAQYISNLRIFNDGQSTMKCNVKNVKCYSGEKIPPLTLYASEKFVYTEEQLVDFADGLKTVSAALPDSYAIFAGYPVAYNAGGYDLVCESDRSLAPVMKNGYIYAPAEYMAKAFGGSFDTYNGTIASGEITASFKEGKVTELSPVAPIVIGEILYVPVCNELASYFGKSLYVDERGLAILGVSENPGENVVKPLINELRSRSSVLGLGVNSEVLYSSRSYSGQSADMAKRFMGTSNRWTYTNEGNDRETMEDLGHLNQSTINAVPTTPQKNNKGETVTYEYNGDTYTVWEGSAYNIEGNVYVRTDGQVNWGCVNKDIYYKDLLGELKAGIDLGQWLWQFDDYALNANYNGGCYCEECVKGFAAWLVEKGYTLESKIGNKLTDNEVNWVKNNGGLENFDIKKYYSECRGISTYADYCKSVRLSDGSYVMKWRTVPISDIYNLFNSEKVHEFLEKLLAEANAYANEKGIEIYMTGNSSNYPGSIKSELRYYDVLDGGIGETDYKNITPDALFGTMLAEQMYGMNYITSLWVRQGRTSMQHWAHVVPLLYATGQNSLIPWDDWVYNSTRWYADIDQLEGNHAFVREYPYLFDNYDIPHQLGYIFDMDQYGGLNNQQIRDMALALGKKGIAFKGIAKRNDTIGPQFTVDTEDFKGIDTAVNVNSAPLTGPEISSKLLRGIDIIAQNGYDGDEFGGKDYADGTNGDGTASYKLVTDPNVAYSGDDCLKITTSANGVTTLRYNFLKEGLVKGKEYEVSFYAKAAPGEKNYASAFISESTPKDNSYYPLSVTNNSQNIDDTEWKKISTTMVVAPYRADDPSKLRYAEEVYQAELVATNDEAKAQAKKEEYLNPASWSDTIGLHVGVKISNPGTVYIDKIEMKEKADVLIDNGYDGQFEIGTEYTMGDKAATYSIDLIEKAPSGGRVINITNTLGNSLPVLRFNDLSNGIEIGKTYEISYDAKAISGKPKTAPFAYNAAPESNTLYPGSVNISSVELSTDQFKKVTGTFKILAHTPDDGYKTAAADSAYKKAIYEDGKTVEEAEAIKAGILNPANWNANHIHAGILLSGGQAYIDNVQIREVPASYTYDANTLLQYQYYEQNYWTARIKDMPEDCFAVLRKHTLEENAPVVVHAVSYATATKENVEVEINNKYLPKGDNFTVKVYAPRKNPYTIDVSKAEGGVTTVTIDELDNWAVLEIFGSDTKSVARFDVDGWSGIGLGSRVSYDSATGTGDSFTITTYSEGINRYTYLDKNAGQDETAFVYRRVETDDFEISGRIDGTGQSGLMFREDVHSNSPAIAVIYDSQNGLRLAWRHTTNIAYKYVDLCKEMPSYLKLSHKNGVVTAYSSDDGVKWTKLGSENVAFKIGVAGVFASSPDGNIALCDVNNLTLTGYNSELELDISAINLMKERNPSFVKGDFVDYVAGYNGLYKGTAEVVVSDESADGDRNSLKLTERSEGNAGLWYRYLPVENGKTYEASVWMKVDKGVSETGSIIVELPAAGESLNGITYDGTITETDISSLSPELSTEWKRAYVRFKVSETGLARGINIRVATNGNNDVYVDNFELKEVHSIGNINASLVQYPNKAVLDLSTNDRGERKITYSYAIKKTNDGASERISNTDLKHITINGDTTSVEIDLQDFYSVFEIYLWETETMSPVMRQLKVRP